LGLSEILPVIKIPLVANSHPLEIDSGIGLLRAFEGFGFVSGFSFPDRELVFAWPAVSGMTGNGFDITADGLDDFPSCHVAVDAPSDVFSSMGSEIPNRN
jgi:hypothetical protein